MGELPIIEIAELNGHLTTTDNFNGIFSITDVDGAFSIEDNAEGYTSPVRMNALFMALVLQGEARVSLDYVPYTLSSNSFIIIMPTHIFQVAWMTPDIKSRLLMVDKSFLDGCHPIPKISPPMNYMRLRNNPCMTLEPEEAAHLDGCIRQLREKIGFRTHAFHKEVLQNAFTGFLLELGNIMDGKEELFVKPSLSRKEELLNSFLQLLFEHAKEQHLVSFYADKLFITPQYLSLILKELTGKPANSWIDDALIIEAKVLLKMPDTTIQQVSNQLNFSDQSTFGKFFKKHLGISPTEYRKKT
ncbi:MAG: helix-turn-helix transcriptional regulator [Tannerellaceae bacterium]|jgi:AraC-like DNA-binding protein|nr:helix-turn-helix transcriptional regulator [Tannerellaceae bacterium]